MAGTTIEGMEVDDVVVTETVVINIKQVLECSWL